MKKTLNFNSVERPTLELVMQDEAQTVIAVTTPRYGLIDKLRKQLPEIKNLTGEDVEAALDALYSLAAELISCNRSGTVITAAELRDVYKMGEEEITLFFEAYLDFINDIKTAKN